MKTWFCLLLGLVSYGFAQRLPVQLQLIGVDTTKSSIPLAEILSGGPPPNGIPALGFAGDWQSAAEATPAPNFVSTSAASAWLKDNEPVIALLLNGEARAYPLQILTWHEIANDTVGGVPVAVTFCPLCNTALAFDRRLPLSQESLRSLSAINDQLRQVDLDEAFVRAYQQQTADTTAYETALELSFGVSGMLYNSNLLMFDDQTSNLFSQLIGEATVGSLRGSKLLRYPAQIVSFGEFRAAFPAALVMSQETGFQRRYGQNPYVGYDDIDSPPFFPVSAEDKRLPAKARVISLQSPSEAVAYPFELIRQRRVIHDEVGAKAIVLFWQTGTSSALDASAIAASADIGAVGVFSPELDGQTLTFAWTGEVFRDAATGSSWNLLGQATEGPLKGSQLEPIVHDNTLWFAWVAFKPETRVFE
jgi:hypothetical protein